MARTPIVKKDGTPTPYFWSDKDGNDRTEKTVYKAADDRVTKMRGVSYDVDRKRIRRS
jgi:hypothetical protein